MWNQGLRQGPGVESGGQHQPRPPVLAGHQDAGSRGRGLAAATPKGLGAALLGPCLSPGCRRSSRFPQLLFRTPLRHQAALKTLHGEHRTHATRTLPCHSSAAEIQNVPFTHVKVHESAALRTVPGLCHQHVCHSCPLSRAPTALLPASRALPLLDIV